MRTVFAYARVSTPRQGEKGVSLTEQREAITRYAERHGLEIVRWFEERESASKRGRPAFNQMLRLLRRGAATGIVIHKIDRSARNLEDWNDIGNLVDAGVDVHFATESVDLTTTAGRLSADIQAVVATHYSRNLRDEVKKGIYGRLKQGFYPFRAPAGYLDQGAAKPKTIDPVRGPLVRSAFKMYASARYGIPELVEEMSRRGLTNRSGGHVTINGIATMLRNTFYIGLMQVGSTGQSFIGKHEQLVPVDVFQRVQRILSGKRVDRTTQHLFTFSRMVRCGTCNYSLIAETKKGHVYYRCHNRPFKNPPICPPTCIREDRIEAVVVQSLASIELSAQHVAIANDFIDRHQERWEQDRRTITNALQLQIQQIDARLMRLTDLLLDATLDKGAFNEKRESLLLERAATEEKARDAEHGGAAALEKFKKTVELAKTAPMLYKTAETEEKRELLKTILSNLVVTEKKIDISLAAPFQMIADRRNNQLGGPNRGNCRTWVKTLREILTTMDLTSSATSPNI